MSDTVTAIYAGQLNVLRKKKRILEFMETYSPANYAEAWTAIANEYAAIDAQANEAYCRTRAASYAQVNT